MAAPIRPLPNIPWPASGIRYREFELDQATIMAALQARRNVHVTSVGGLCAAFVVDWVTRITWGRIPNQRTYNNANGDGIKAIAAAQFQSYLGHNVGVPQVSAVARAMGADAHLVASGNGSATYGTMGAPAVIAGAIIKCQRPAGYLKIEGGGASHAIGFQVRMNTCRFFDPNFGQFSFPSTREFSVAFQSLLEFEYSEMTGYSIFDFTAMPHA